MVKELIKGVLPNLLSECTIHKTVEKDQKSFRITSKLLKQLCNKADKLKKQGRLVITITDGKETFEVSAIVTRSRED